MPPADVPTMETRPAPRLRSDLDVVTRSEDRQGRLHSSKIVVDPASGDVFELGEEDYFICEQLDGERSEDSIRSVFEERFGLELEVRHLRAFIRQLGQLGLLVEGRPRVSPFLSELFRFLEPEDWKKWDLFHPGRLFAQLDRMTRWSHSKAFTTATAVMALLAAGVLMNNFPMFMLELQMISLTWSLPGLLVVYYLCVNLPGALVLGTNTVHHGGRADEFGIRLLFDVWPIFYTHARTEEISRRERCLVRFSAIRYGLAVGATGLLLWRMTSPATGLHTFFAVAAIASTLNASIRLNVLWSTDAAQILASWHEIPFLRERAVAVSRAWWLRREPTEPLAPREARLFRIYGTLVDLMSVTTLVAIAYLVAEMLGAWGGNGALLLLAVALTLYRRTWMRLFRSAKAA